MKFSQRGVTVMLILVFMGILSIMIVATTGYVLAQAKVGREKVAREQALVIAESGLEYYRWFLAHFPGNTTDGTGVQGGTYTHVVNDPEGGVMGQYDLTISSTTQCGALQRIDITSVGSSNTDTRFKRTLTARYAQPSVAEYSYIINGNVWAGADRNIVGPYFANGGIRMDGTNNSTVMSGVASWTCTSSFGCSPNSTKNGVFGAGSGSALWQYPVPQFDFNGLSTNFTDLKTKATNFGLYFAPSTVGGTDQRGYHMILRSDGTVDVYKVTGTQSAQAIHIDDLSTWVNDYHTITTETYVGRYTIPTTCAVIFVEAKLWLEGTVSGKVTIVAATPTSSTYDPDIILQNNINYTALDGNHGLTAIAEHSVLVPLVSPNVLTVRGVFVAQTGYFGRNLYPCWYAPNDERSSMTVFGAVVSNQRVGTQWTYSTNGCPNNSTSGYATRTDSYDRLLAFSPPPFTPSASPDFKFILWREQ